MWFATLFRCLSGKVAHNQEPRTNRRSVPLRHRKGSARSRPRLEGLEDRTVPSGSYVFTTIDDLNGTGGSFANAINSRGDILGGFLDARFIVHGFLLSHGQYTTLDDPNAVFDNFATGINASGQIVGGYADANFVFHGFLLSHGQYTTFDDPDTVNDTAPTGINASGQIVGTYLDANFVFHGFLLSGGRYTTLDDPSAGTGSLEGTSPTGINARGEIVGYYGDANFGLHGFLLSGGQYTTFDPPNSTLTFANTINDHGQILGTYFDANFNEHGFLLSGGQYTTIDDPNGAPGSTFASGINDSGQIVGSYSDANGFGHAFLATPSQEAPVESAPSPGVHPGKAGVMGITLPWNRASLDHARLLRIQVNSEAGEFGVVLGQALGRKVPGPTTTIVTVPTRNGDAAGLMGQDGGTRIVSAAATRSKDLKVIEYEVFDRNDKLFDPGLFLQ
jgi:probable HAF family extracellular repeat protein